MRFKLIVLMIIMLSWMWDLPVDLYPAIPPSVQIRGKPATDPLNRGISQHFLSEGFGGRVDARTGNARTGPGWLSTVP
jgi:hypothetical protein